MPSWACIAVEAEELHEVLRVEAKERQGQRTDLTSDNELSKVKKGELQVTVLFLNLYSLLPCYFAAENAKVEGRGTKEFKTLKG